MPVWIHLENLVKRPSISSGIEPSRVCRRPFAPQRLVAGAGDRVEPFLVVIFRREPDPGREIAAAAKACGSGKGRFSASIDNFQGGGVYA
jgi:hypothetical protein